MPFGNPETQSAPAPDDVHTKTSQQDVAADDVNSTTSLEVMVESDSEGSEHSGGRPSKEGKKNHGAEAAHLGNLVREMESATLKERVKIWLGHDKDEEFLHNGPRDEVQRELRAWIDRRFFNYEDIKTLRIHCQTQCRERILRRNEQHEDYTAKMVTAAERWEWMSQFALNMAGSARLEEQQERQDCEADFLCETLSKKHGLVWDDLSVNPTPSDADVVGALVALGQPDVDQNTLLALEDHEDEQRLLRNGRYMDRERERLDRLERDLPRGLEDLHGKRGGQAGGHARKMFR